MMAENRLAADLDHILDHTRGLWDELRGGRIFITGGTGFFGCWLLESFAWANDRLGLKARALVLSRNPEAFRQKAPHLAGHPAIQFLRGDVRTFDFPAGTFSHVIHAANESVDHVGNANLLDLWDITTKGTRRTLDFSINNGAQKILFTSSGAVYGANSDAMPVNEESPSILVSNKNINIKTIYMEGKLLSELQCELFTEIYGKTITIARCFAFVGPYQPLNSHFAIANFIRDGLRGDPIYISGDGTPFRSYLYGADLAIWLWTILFLGRSGRIYNVGSDEAVNIATLANIVAELIVPKPKIIIKSKVNLNQAPEKYFPSIQRAKEELSLIPWINLQQAIKKTFEWHSGL